MSLEGHIENGVVVFDEPLAIPPDGTHVRVEPIPPPRTAQAERLTNVDVAGVDLPEDSSCFHNVAVGRPLDASTKDALRALLTAKQYKALVEVVDQGGLDVDAIRRLRAASMV
jgi:hypothetical protein